MLGVKGGVVICHGASDAKAVMNGIRMAASLYRTGVEGDIARAFFERVLAQAKAQQLVSAEHFTVDGTLIEAWASVKSFRPKDDPPPEGGGCNPAVDFHGEKCLNQTHASTTDPEARQLRKGKSKEAKLCFMGHVLMENRHGLILSPRHRKCGQYWDDPSPPALAVPLQT